MGTTVNVVYNRRDKLDKHGKAPVEIVISINRKRKWIPTGVRIEPEYWNEEESRITNHSLAVEYNRAITKIRTDIERLEITESLAGRTLTWTKVDLLMRKKSADSFLEYYQRTSESRNDITEATKRHHRSTLSYLRQFERINKFTDLTYENISALDRWLRNKGLKQNTITNQHKRIRIYIGEAIRSGMMSPAEDPYLRFRMRTEKTTRTVLTREELRKIEKLELTGTIGFIRDIFLFAAYTGIRYEDIMALRPGNIETDGGTTYIRFTMQKVSKEISLPLSTLFDGKPTEYLDQALSVNRLSNQQANQYLKVIASAAGIGKALTFHVSRHTFGTLLADKAGDPFLIKTLMGHGDIRTSMVYIHESRKGIDDKLKGVKW